MDFLAHSPTGPRLRGGDDFWRRFDFGALLGLALFLPTIAQAQALNCRVPANLSVPAEPTRQPDGPMQELSGSLLALSWSPQFCRDKKANPKHRHQCSGANGKFGFIVHGLWPDSAGRMDPAYCAPATALEPALLKRYFCMTPSADLMQHEWAKHGTCASSQPEPYFAEAKRRYDKIRFPDMDRLSRQPMTVGQFRQAFSFANRGLRPDAISVQTARGGWLKEVRLCIGLKGLYRACPKEDRGTPPTQALRIWRG